MTNRRHDISHLNKLLYTVYAGWSRATCLLEQALRRRLLRGVCVEPYLPLLIWLSYHSTTLGVIIEGTKLKGTFVAVETFLEQPFNHRHAAVFCTTINIPINTFTVILIGLSEVSYL